MIVIMLLFFWLTPGGRGDMLAGEPNDSSGAKAEETKEKEQPSV